MQVVYLDQNAASFLANPSPDSIWSEIRQALADGFRGRKVLCALPFESVLETAPCSLQFLKAVQSLFWQLSEGVAFKEFTEMSNELTLAPIRPMPDWSPWLDWVPKWAEMEGAAE